MSATVYTTAGGTRFHFDRACWALAGGRDTSGYLAFERGYGYDDRRPLHVLRTRSNLGAALLGYTACRVCVPPAHALPATGETYGHEPVHMWPDGIVCARCYTRTWHSAYAEPEDTEPERWDEIHNVRWPCTSAVVLGLVVTDADRWNARYPIGARVLAYPGTRRDKPLLTRTRTPAWRLGHGASVVSVDGYAGGIYLTHVEAL